ncbi:hypothetical protein AGMMS50268_31010 [Spirochaetia bacterium]|nr:hypothetical protein AGMMS50268_31010 [Spirochaetia bacterium]
MKLFNLKDDELLFLKQELASNTTMPREFGKSNASCQHCESVCQSGCGANCTDAASSHGH